MQVPDFTQADLAAFRCRWSDETSAVKELAGKISRVLRENPITDIKTGPKRRVEPDTWVVDLSESGSVDVSDKLKAGLLALGYECKFYGPSINELMPLSVTASHFVEIKLREESKSQNAQLAALKEQGWDIEVRVETQRTRIQEALHDQYVQIVARIYDKMGENPSSQKFEMSVLGFSERVILKVKSHFDLQAKRVELIPPVQFANEGDGALLIYRIVVLNIK